MKNFKGLHKCAEGAIINTEDFMKSSMAPGSMMGGPGDRIRLNRNPGKHGNRVKQSRTARQNTPCRGSRCYKPNTH
jgi:hypothetical protein